LPNSASHNLTAFSSIALKTGLSSPGDELMMRNTSEVAFSRATDACSSWVSRATCISGEVSVEL